MLPLSAVPQPGAVSRWSALPQPALSSVPRRELHTTSMCRKSIHTLPDMVVNKPWSAKVMLIMGTASFVGAFLMGFNASKEWVEQNPEEVFRKLIPSGQPWPAPQKTQKQEDEQTQELAKAKAMEKDEIQRAKEQLAINKKDLGAQLVRDTLNMGR